MIRCLVKLAPVESLDQCLTHSDYSDESDKTCVKLLFIHWHQSYQHQCQAAGAKPRMRQGQLSKAAAGACVRKQYASNFGIPFPEMGTFIIGV